MKKYLSLLWNKFNFYLLALLAASIVVGLGISIQSNFRSSPEATIKPTPSHSDTPINPSPSKTKDNLTQFQQKPSPSDTSVIPLPSNPGESLTLFPPKPSPDLFHSEENYQQLPQPSNTLSQVKTYLNHFPYSENPQPNLVKVADFYGREEFLDRAVASAFTQMKSDAKASGVDLTLISGFRSIAQQEKLFQKQINRRGSKEAAARLSAPPGYSEHHTGYALDIGQGEDIDTFLKFDFENTRAYRWLMENAKNYGFELSFPEGNSQGVSYEPWHWRYVGSPEATTIFASARRENSY